MNKDEKHTIFNSLTFPLLFVAIIGVVHFLSFALDISLVNYGILPRDKKGLIGILLSPLIHADFKHLINNSIPIIILGAALFYFYKEIAFKICIWIYLMVGAWTWVSAREAYHIGASGLLYGLFSFILVSGFLRKNKQLIALSFVVIFIYGSLVWGIFPIDIKVSFEGHLWGFIAGVVLAIFYRKKGPQKKEFVWNDDDLDESNPYWKEGITEFEYDYKPTTKD